MTIGWPVRVLNLQKPNLHISFQVLQSASICFYCRVPRMRIFVQHCKSIPVNHNLYKLSLNEPCWEALCKFENVPSKYYKQHIHFVGVNSACPTTIPSPKRSVHIRTCRFFSISAATAQIRAIYHKHLSHNCKQTQQKMRKQKWMLLVATRLKTTLAIAMTKWSVSMYFLTYCPVHSYLKENYFTKMTFFMPCYLTKRAIHFIPIYFAPSQCTFKNDINFPYQSLSRTHTIFRRWRDIIYWIIQWEIFQLTATLFMASSNLNLLQIQNIAFVQFMKFGTVQNQKFLNTSQSLICLMVTGLRISKNNIGGGKLYIIDSEYPFWNTN